jgi:hypothetical protein
VSRLLRRAAGALALVILSSVVTLVLLEGGLQIYHLLHPANPRGVFWEPDPDYGWRHPAGNVGPWHDDLGEFTTHVAINSKGLRDVEHAYEKPPGVFRILILGDSYMEGMQVELDAAFPRLLERELNARAGRPVEVIGSGVASYGTDNELLYFRHEGYKYHPDLVLLAFTTANDVRENYAPLNAKSPGSIVTKPIFSIDTRGNLAMRPAPVQPPPLPWWRRDTYLGDVLYRHLRRAGFFVDIGGSTVRPPADPNVRYVPVDLWVHQPEYTDEMKEAWRLTTALILAVRDEATAHGARFGLFEVNAAWQHYDNDWNVVMSRDPVARQTWDRRKPNEVLGAFLGEQQIPSLDLFDAFETAKGGERLFFGYDPHWTARGHEVAARAVAEFLLRRDLVPHADVAAPKSAGSER